MTNEDKILVEQYFPAQNLDENDRNFYLNLLLHSKELTSSDYNFRDSSPSNYDFVFMSLNDEGSIVRFDGAITNGEENKLMYGAILRRGEKYYIFSDVYRLFELVFGDDKEYRVTDEFSFKDGSVTRKSSYGTASSTVSKVTLKTDEEMEEYLQGKIGSRKKGRL